MKINCLFTAITLQSLSVACFSSAARAQYSSMQYSISSPCVTASGTGEIHTNPDRAFVSLAIKNWDRNLQAACKQNDSRLKSVLALQSKYKIDPVDVQTSEITVEATYPDRSRSGGMTYSATHSTPEGYEIDKTVTFLIRDIATVPDLLNSALAAGATNITSIHFDKSKLREGKDKARILAVRAAREKAAAMAAELNERLGKAILVRETGTYETGNSATRSNDNAMDRDYETRDASDARADFAPGTLTIGSSVSVTFELKD